MSVTACNFIKSTCKEDASKFANYISLWEAITDDKTNGPALIRQHPGLPQVGDTYSTPYGDEDTAATAIGRDIDVRDETETGRIYRVAIQYTTNPGLLPSRDPEDPPQLPWNEPPEISTHSLKDKEAFLFDLNGKMIASSAGEPYDPVQERDKTKFILRISRNVQFSDIAFNASYRDCINSDPFFGCDPDTVKIETPGAVQRLWFGATPYYNETWEFAINTDEWLLRLYDYGMYRKVGDGESAKLEVMRDLHNQPLNAPRFLNLGDVLPIGSPPVFITPDQSNLFIDYFEVYRRKAFGPLNLPQSF